VCPNNLNLHLVTIKYTKWVGAIDNIYYTEDEKPEVAPPDALFAHRPS